MLCGSCHTQPHTKDDCDYPKSCTCGHVMKPKPVEGSTTTSGKRDAGSD